MRQLLRLEGLSRFCLDWQRLSHTCEEYAKQFGLACISLAILRLIEDGTTQKELSSALCLPKQAQPADFWEQYTGRCIGSISAGRNKEFCGFVSLQSCRFLPFCHNLSRLLVHFFSISSILDKTGRSRPPVKEWMQRREKPCIRHKKRATRPCSIPDAARAGLCCRPSHLVFGTTLAIPRRMKT